MGHLPRSAMSGLELLSMVADMSLEAFALSHSSIPYRRSITSSMPDLPHGSTQRRSLLCNWGMTRMQPDAYFCSECAAEDVLRHGTSYWHRNHQIPGRYWCDRHGIPLRYCQQRDAFFGAPSNLPSPHEAISLEIATEWSRAPNISRFLAIAEGLGSRTSPLDVSSVSKVLKAQALNKMLNCAAREVSGRDLLSDLISESFPLPWLEHIVPSLPMKQKGQIFHRLDGVLRMSNASSSAWVYMLAASVLFETTEQALDALCSPPSIAPARSKRPRQHYKNLNKRALLQTYVECQGHHSVVADRMSLPPHIVKAKLQEAGLPNLVWPRFATKRPRVSADAYYLGGKAFDESARSGGLTTNEMAKLLASSASNFKEVLKAMAQPIKPRRCSFMRDQGQSAH